MDWGLIKGLRVRAMQQRATRAPNVQELYAPVVTGLGSLATDPCQGTRINAADAGRAGTLTNLCQQTGVPTALIGRVGAPSAGQLNITTGGNINLGPEEADTTTLGFVWEPDFVRGLGLTVDFYRIKVNKAIATPLASQWALACYDPAKNSSFALNDFCRGIARDGLTGSLNQGTGFSMPTTNEGSFDVGGIDVGASYRLPVKGLGRFDFAVQLSYMDKWDFKARPVMDTVECAGNYGLNCGTPYSKTKVSQRTNWTYGDFTLGYNWRFISGVKEEPGGDVFQPQFSTIKAYNYIDLNASWKATKNIKVSLAINNAADKDAPMVGNTIGGTGPNSGNTFPQSYDVLGRRYSVTVQASF